MMRLEELEDEVYGLACAVGSLQADMAELREYVAKLETANLDVTARLADYIGQYDPTDAFVAEVKAENAKLRELVERLYGSYYIEYPDAAEREFAGELRELGLEVE